MFVILLDTTQYCIYFQCTLCFSGLHFDLTSSSPSCNSTGCCSVTGGRTGVVTPTPNPNPNPAPAPAPAPGPCAWCRTVEFFWMTSTTCRPSSINGLGALQLSRSERCFACVRLRTNFDSVIVSCSCLESDCRDGWDSAARRSTASVFP